MDGIASTFSQAPLKFTLNGSWYRMLDASRVSSSLHASTSSSTPYTYIQGCPAPQLSFVSACVCYETPPCALPSPPHLCACSLLQQDGSVERGYQLLTHFIFALSATGKLCKTTQIPASQALQGPDQGSPSQQQTCSSAAADRCTHGARSNEVRAHPGPVNEEYPSIWSMRDLSTHVTR